MLEPGLCLKSGTFSNGKTVNSVKDSSHFNPFKQINIFNQPTGYNHIMIKTPNDLINILKDIYHYHLYYNSYNEKIEQLQIYKQALHNYNENIETKNKALNLKKNSNPFKRLKQSIKIKLGFTSIINLSIEQIKKEIHYIENIYLKERKQFTDKYGENLILDYFNYISLDEAQIYFGSRSWGKNFSGKNEFLKDFISYPVKLNSRLEPIVQNPNMLDVNFRRQASTYKLHKSFLFDIIQKTEVIEVDDPEKVNLSDAKTISKKYRLNLYKLFGFPKYQYYRKHLIRPNDPDIYRPGLYFEYIKSMTEKKEKLENKKNNKNK